MQAIFKQVRVGVIGLAWIVVIILAVTLLSKPVSCAVRQAKAAINEGSAPSSTSTPPAPATVKTKLRYEDRVWSDQVIIAEKDKWGKPFSVVPPREAIEKLGPGTLAVQLVNKDGKGHFDFRIPGLKAEYNGADAGNVGSSDALEVIGRGQDVNVAMYWYVH